MGAHTTSGLFQIGIGILKTIRDAATKSILAQTGDDNGRQTETDNVEMWYPPGYISRPSNPEAGKQACQGIVLRDTAHDVCIATRDIRSQELAGQLDAGETCVYAPGLDGKGQARVILKKDGSIFIYTRLGNSPSGAGMAIIVDPTSDTISLINSVGYGIVIDPDGVKVTAKDSGLTLNADGSWKCIGTGQAQIDGSSIVHGSIAVPGVNSALTGVTGVAGKASLKNFIE